MKTSQIAAAYIDRLGICVVALKPKSKKPYGENWMNFSDSKEAVSFYNDHPDCGIGVNLGKSRICSADLDWPEAIQIIEDEFGLPFSTLKESNATVIGNAPRIMFRVPEGVDLGYCKLNWVGKDGKSKTVLELRSVSTGEEKSRQDVLPPSIHPDTGKAYQWLTKPTASGINEPPEWLLNVWKNWDFFKKQLESANPFVERHVEIKSKPAVVQDGLSVCQQFDDANDLLTMLDRYGYKKCGRRWLSPHSSTKLPGVHIMGNKCWIHHASDPLCSEDTGYPVGPFDLFTQYEHGGDYKASTKAAAKMLGIERKLPIVAPPESVQMAVNASELDDVIQTLPRNKDGGIIASYTSMVKVVGTLKLGYDSFLESPMIERNGKWELFDDPDYVDIALYLESVGFVSPSMQKVKDIAKQVISKNRFDSAINWINSLVWDGTDRCTHLFAGFFGAEQSDYESAVSLYFVTAMAARALIPGAKCDMVPILLGKQGAKKTTAVQGLAPMVDSFTEVDLSGRKDADLARQLRGKLIGELGELRGLKTKESEWIKAWITRTHEEWTPKFVEFAKKMPRRCVFIGTTNEDEFLVDQTGNRRWLPIKVNECDVDAIIAQRDQIWAQAAFLFKIGGVMWQRASELADGVRDEHMVYDDYMMDMVREILSGHSFIGKDKIRLMDIAKELFEGRTPSRADQHRIADALRGLGYERKHSMTGKVFVKN